MRGDTREIRRLENLWSGGFGNAYLERNRNAGQSRREFWDTLLGEFKVDNLLEVGCNQGANLGWISKSLSPRCVVGLDVNFKALLELQNAHALIHKILGTARQLPFGDQSFELVFTMGVLIHQPEASLRFVMDEIYRCSSRYILCGEYYSKNVEEVKYRGQTGALFKRDYGTLYNRAYPDLILRKKGFLSKAQLWDDVTYWLFEKETKR